MSGPAQPPVPTVFLLSPANLAGVRLTDAFGARLLFPPEFVGRGDMSRGALMLRAARDGQELAYEALEGARRRGPRAPGVGGRRSRG
jgi:hypothetical protein